jgi:ribosome-binding protein aMBF1 (putative translation factor)
MPKSSFAAIAQCPPDPPHESEAMTKLATLKTRLMKNPKFRREYEKADAEFSIVEALIKARTVAKLSQAEVAKRIGTTQSAVARLEAGNTKPTIPTLRRYAEATGRKLRIELTG